MKKIFLYLAFIACSVSSQAQNDKTLAMDLVVKNSSKLGLTQEDLKNSVVSDSYYNTYSGTQMVYLQQTHLGLPVYNQLQVLAFKNGNPVSNAGSRVSNITEKAGLIAFPSVTAEQAVMTTLKSKNSVIVQSLKSNTQSATKFNFGKLGIAFEDVTAELMWVPSKKGKEVKLAWQVYFVPLKSSDYFLTRIDAHKNVIIDESNLTVYCKADHIGSGIDIADCTSQFHSAAAPESPQLVGTANYRVIPFPAESPRHPGGNHALVTNPWTLTPGNATTLGWHNDGTFDYLSTRGNNVFAQEDRDGSNSTFGTGATSTTSPDPLNFNFTPDLTVTPTQTSPIQNQQFNITNLFYWNNIIHDLSYVYGFDEVSGNFQNSNMGRGGQGTDYVIADAQDDGGSNNANFATPPDGQRPRMQMYLWGGGIARDGAVDNGIVVHEYGHGISNRLTGGPSNAGCLQNEEQMGEGWSDYFTLMYTQDWANSDVNSGFSSPRGIGTYATGGTPASGGLRTQKYSTNFTVNNKVYAATLPGETHDRGELWAATLWDMTWNIINQVGTINPNLFNASSTGGNSIALKLVMEGMKLQPCSPGFIDGRDAIIRADQLLYGGQFNCAIREAFRRRGMGGNASQGSSEDVTDQTPDFSGGVSVVLSQGGMTEVPEGQNIIYTNTVSSLCEAITNYTLRDTLPANVTYVSGGSYDPATRIVSFAVNQPAGGVQDYTFTVRVNDGSYFPTTTLFEETFAASSFPASMTTTATPASASWKISSLTSHSAPNSIFAENLASTADQRLQTTNTITLPAGTSPRLSFWHRYNTEAGWDGGVVELSTNNGTTWRDLGSVLIEGKYSGMIGSNMTNVLAGRQGFTGTQTTFINTIARLTQYAGQNVKIRFRFGSDDNTSADGNPKGWFVDDIKLFNQAVVDMRTGLHNASNVAISISDTSTIITEAPSCVSVSILTQPSNTAVCTGGTASISVAANGTTPGFQWQVSTNGGTSYSNIPGANSATLTLTGVTTGMNNNRYRVILTNTCPSDVTSSAAVLSVGTPAAITSQPVNVTGCSGTNAAVSVTATGSTNTYQWQVSTDGGTTFTDITGETSAALSLSPLTTGMNGNRYRVVISSCAAPVTSQVSLVSVNESLTINTQPSNTSSCPGGNATFTVTASGNSPAYQWQISTDGGTTFNNIAGATSSTLTLNAVTPAMNNNRYRVVLNNTCSSNLTSSAAILTVSAAVAITSQPSAVTGCAGENVVFSVSATSATSFQWQVSTNGGTSYSDITGETGTTLSITASPSLNGNLYRVVVSGCGATSLTSQGAPLTVNNAAVIQSQPSPVSVCAGSPASFNITVNGSSLSYQWQVSTNGGTSFSDIPGATSGSLTLPAVTAGMNNNQYRVKINGTCTNDMNSNAAVLTINNGAVITSQPSSRTGCISQSADFSVTASGATAFQWQISTDGGTTFSDISGATSATLNLASLQMSSNGNQYRVLITGSCGEITSSSAVLTVNNPPTVEASGPLNPVCAGENIVLSGSGAASYSWSNGIANNVGFAASSTTTYTVTGTDVNSCTGTATITVVVNPLPVVTISAPQTLIDPDGTVTITAVASTATPNGFQWFKNGIPVPNANGNTLVVNSNEAGDYTAGVTDANGCEGISNSLTLSIAGFDTRFFITPNPNFGLFTVKYSNAETTATSRVIAIYDAKGSRIYTKTFPVSASSIETMNIDLGNVPSGIYMLAILENGKVVKSGKVRVL